MNYSPDPYLFHVDEVSDVVRGWALCVYDQEPVTITLWVDGQECGHFKADQFRPDLKGLGYNHGMCGFRFAFPVALCDGNEHEVMLTLGRERRAMLPHSKKIRLSRRSGEIEGHLDALETGFYVSGWVSGGDQVEICDGDQVLASGRAGLHRSDLLLEGKSGLGFRLQLNLDKLLKPVARLTARCSGKPLAGSVHFNVDAHARLEVEEEGAGCLRITLAGWPVRVATVQVLVDGEVCDQCSLQRPSDSKFGDFPYGIWRIPEAFADGQCHVVQVRGTGALKWVSSDPRIVRWPEFRFAVDQVTADSITGWALELGRSDSLLLEVRIDGFPPFKIYANHPRIDVAQAFQLRYEEVGFHFQVGFPLAGRVVDILDSKSGIVLARIKAEEPTQVLSSLQSIASTQGGDEAVLRSVLGYARNTLPVQPLVSVLAFPAPDCGEDAIDVIVPVYSGAAETVECIESVLSAENKTEHRVVIINDCSPDARITSYLRDVAERNSSRVVLIERRVNGGFSQAVNFGMIVAGRRDVILLNADTVVSGDWIDRIASLRKRDPLIGTITPLSNNGEICSLPYICKSVDIGCRELFFELDEVASRSVEKPVDLPVAVGYCMFIRRQCLDEVGLFDSEAWGRGYGEEVDFCLKASARGWRHVLAPNVFVVHRGGVSFADEKIPRIMESSRKIAERYPFYDLMVQRFIEQDPPYRARRHVNLGLLARRLRRPRVLHITHDFGGGTAKYVADMTSLYADAGYSVVILAFEATGKSKLTVNTSDADAPTFFMSLHEERFSAVEAGELVAVLSEFQFNCVHVHAPFGVPAELIQWLMHQSFVYITVHDYAWICPAVICKAEDASGISDCDCCHDPVAVHPGLRAFAIECRGDAKKYSKIFAPLFAHAKYVFVAGEDVRRRLRAAGLDARYRVVAHPRVLGRDRVGPLVVSRHRGAYRVAVIGAISTVKGFAHLVSCVHEAQRRRLPIEFIIFGFTENDDALRDYPNVKILGRYKDSELPKLLAEWQPDVGLFLNQGPETYSYTLSEAMDVGLWPIVTDLGVPAERVHLSGFGDVVPKNIEADALVARILEIARQRRAGRGPEFVEEARPTTLDEYLGNQRPSVEVVETGILRGSEKLQL